MAIIIVFITCMVGVENFTFVPDVIHNFISSVWISNVEFDVIFYVFVRGALGDP